MANQSLTLEEGLEIQAGNLRFWKRLLNEETYGALEGAVKAENHRRRLEGRLNTGYDVPRGQCLTTWLLNIDNDYNPLKSA